VGRCATTSPQIGITQGATIWNEPTACAGGDAHAWNVNPQASLSYTIAKSDALFVTFADRGRFPILKKSYSYRLGQAMRSERVQKIL
jgi:hypothetical protein